MRPLQTAVGDAPVDRRSGKSCRGLSAGWLPFPLLLAARVLAADLADDRPVAVLEHLPPGLRVVVDERRLVDDGDAALRLAIAPGHGARLRIPLAKALG